MDVFRIIKSKYYGDGEHSAVLRTLLFASANRGICGSLILAQVRLTCTAKFHISPEHYMELGRCYYDPEEHKKKTHY